MTDSTVLIGTVPPPSTDAEREVIAAVLPYVNPAGGKLKLPPESPLIEPLLAFARPLAAGRTAELRLPPPAELPQADADQLGHVWEGMEPGNTRLPITTEFGRTLGDLAWNLHARYARDGMYRPDLTAAHFRVEFTLGQKLVQLAEWIHVESWPPGDEHEDAAPVEGAPMEWVLYRALLPGDDLFVAEVPNTVEQFRTMVAAIEQDIAAALDVLGLTEGGAQ